MDEDIRRALSHGQTIDITTTGRRTGQPRRIEIVFHVFDGRLYISGTPSPRTRAWIHNLEADPRLTFHLKGPEVVADLRRPRGSSTTKPNGARSSPRSPGSGGGPTSRRWSEYAPLIEVTIVDETATTAA